MAKKQTTLFPDSENTKRKASKGKTAKKKPAKKKPLPKIPKDQPELEVQERIRRLGDQELAALFVWLNEQFPGELKDRFDC